MSRRLQFVALLCSLVVLVAAFLLLRPSALESQARDFREAIMAGDGAGMFRLAGPQEIGCSAITPDKLHQVWDKLVRPSLANLKRTGGRSDIEGAQASAYAIFEHQGSQKEIAVVIDAADDGPRTSVLSTLLMVAWRFDTAGVLHDTLQTSHVRDGIQRDRATLEAIGITHIARGQGFCETWDAYIAVLDRAIARPAQPPQSNPDARSPTK